MPRRKLQSGDFRPIRPGDIGYTREKDRARWYYSPDSEMSVPYRVWRTDAANNVSYEKEAAAKREQGIPIRQYKPRKKKLKIMGGTPIHNRNRRDILKAAWERRHGHRIEWSTYGRADSPEQIEFWNVYHELTRERKMTRNAVEYYGEYFDLTYEEFFDLDLGPS